MSKENLYTYPPFAEWKWRSYDGKTALNLDEFIEKHIANAVFIIGTDSRNFPKSKKCILTTAVIAYTFGRGGSL